MTQYLIRQFEDRTGHIHTNVEKARENETLHIIEASSKEQALKILKGQRTKEALEKLLVAYKNFRKKVRNND